MLLQLIISGLITGSLYALAGVGLTVIYKATEVMNFAQGDMAALVAFAALWGMQHVHLPYGVAFALAVVAGALFAGVVQYVLVRRLQNRSALSVVVATLGLGLIINAVVVQWFGSEGTSFPPILADHEVRIGAAVVSTNSLLSFGIALAALAAVWLLFQRTKAGMIIRAAYQNPNAARLMGVNLQRVYLGVWALSGALGALSALLLAPILYLDPNVLNLVLLSAFTAVVLGGFGSLVGAAVGGLVLGVVSNLLGAYVSTNFQNSFVFLMLLLVLLIRPVGLFGQRSLVKHADRVDFGASARRQVRWRPVLIARGLVVRMAHAVTARRAQAVTARAVPATKPAPASTGVAASSWLDRANTPLGRRLLVGVLILVVAMLAPFVVDGPTLAILATAAIGAPVVLSLVVLTGYTAQASLGQAAFMAVGAFVTGVLSNRTDIPFPIIMLLAVLASVFVGVVIGIPGTRLSGLYLAVATLGFGIAVPEVLINLPGLTGGYQGLQVSPPFTSDGGRYYFAVIAVAIVFVVVWRLLRSSIGRRWKALRDSEAGAASIGINPMLLKTGGFAVSAALAGFGGSLYALVLGYVVPDGFSFNQSILYLVAAVIGGLESTLGAILGALIITLVPFYASSGSGELPQFIFGGAVILIVIVMPLGLAEILHQLLAWLVGLPGARKRSRRGLDVRGGMPREAPHA